MSHNRKISVLGLGYVGLTIATAFGQMQNIIGYDKNEKRIADLTKYHDINREISPEILKNSKIEYTTNPENLKKADFHIIAVPTPVNIERQPDLSFLVHVSETLGKQLKKGDIVVYESSVYPGATEEKCIPILEKHSKLVCGKDFSVGFSPERINPSDQEHIFSNIIKIISAIDDKTLDVIDDVYSSVIKAGVHRVSSIRVAEATKVVENTQRDINISLMNEISLILHSMEMDSFEVISAARTKWNFLPFQPGLVGGHCIGVNSQYLAFKAKEAGFNPDVIQAGRRINDYMSKFLAETTVKNLIHLAVPIKSARVGVLGLTYKENCPDMNDSRVIELIKELKSYEIEVIVHDPIANREIAKNEFGIEILPLEKLPALDAIILTLAHKEYLSLNTDIYQKMLTGKGLIMDIKGILDPKDFSDSSITLWRL